MTRTIIKEGTIQDCGVIAFTYDQINFKVVIYQDGVEVIFKFKTRAEAWGFACNILDWD